MFYVSLKTSVTAVTAIWLSVAVAADAKADAASCPSSIPFGLTTALTGNWRCSVRRHATARIRGRRINAGGGIAGKKIALTTEDTGASSTDALNAMNRILEGSSCYPWIDDQPACIRADGSRHQIGDPLSGRATNAKVTMQGSKWLFRTHVHDGQLAELIPEYLVKTLARPGPHHGGGRRLWSGRIQGHSGRARQA